MWHMPHMNAIVLNNRPRQRIDLGEIRNCGQHKCEYHPTKHRPAMRVRASRGEIHYMRCTETSSVLRTVQMTEPAVEEGNSGKAKKSKNGLQDKQSCSCEV